jgi:hypothetical protein
VKHLLYVVAGVIITVWQALAGIQRCGAIDGGVLIVPLVLLAFMLVRGVARDLREVFTGRAPVRARH